MGPALASDNRKRRYRPIIPWHQLQAPEVLSLKLGKVSQLLNTSCVVEVPKTLQRKDLSSHQSLALILHLMKILKG
ncbi:hypothetical protein XENOCAPTIV_024834, partial [Xenoophorus captivus]